MGGWVVWVGGWVGGEMGIKVEVEVEAFLGNSVSFFALVYSWWHNEV